LRAVVQRVRSASVDVDGSRISSIGPGLAVLLGVGKGDGEEQARWLADKIANLRIFEDGDGRMNLSLLETGGEALVVSQFTLYGDARKGRRPAFDGAAPPAEAERLYERFLELLGECGVSVKAGRFQARMLFTIENSGPVTIVIETGKG
jgi:D-aminoacyl-tRNA deacylase